jgi:hypothetical protein
MSHDNRSAVNDSGRRNAHIFRKGTSAFITRVSRYIIARHRAAAPFAPAGPCACLSADGLRLEAFRIALENGGL